MKIREVVETLSAAMGPRRHAGAAQRLGRIHCDDGLSGIGEASPMQGGLASLGIIARDLAPLLVGQDPLDHAVLHDTLLHRFAKLGPEGALSGALAAIDIALWDLKGKMPRPADLQAVGRRLADRPAVLRVDLGAAMANAASTRSCASIEARLQRPAGGGRNPLRQRPAPSPTSTSPATSPRRARCGGWSATYLARLRRQQRLLARRCRPCRARARRARVLVVRGAGCQHYHVKAMGEVARRLDITVSAGEQTYTLS